MVEPQVELLGLPDSLLELANDVPVGPDLVEAVDVFFWLNFEAFFGHGTIFLLDTRSSNVGGGGALWW